MVNDLPNLARIGSDSPLDKSEINSELMLEVAIQEIRDAIR